MARRRIDKTTAPALRSWAGVDDALHRIRELDALIVREEAAKDAHLREVQAKYDAVIIPRIEQRDALGRALEAFVKVHQDDLEGRSRRLNHGIVGYRKGQRAVRTLKGWTLQKALEALLNAGKRSWIAIKKSVDKEAILKSDPPQAELDKFGLEIKQEERFYYETAEVETVNPGGKEG